MRPDRAWRSDILVAIEDIRSFLAGKGLEELEGSAMLQRSVLHGLITIGEAANRLDPYFHQRYSQIRWRSIIDFRTMAVHAYYGVDLGLVWGIVQKELDPLQATVKQILEEHPDSSPE